MIQLDSQIAEPPVPPAPVPGADENHMTVRRLIRMAAVVSIFLLIVNGFVCATFAHFIGVHRWLAWQLIPGSLAVSFVVTFVLGYFHSSFLLRTICTLSASWLGALNFAFFASTGCWGAEGIVLLAGVPVPRFEIGGFFFGLAGLATVYGLINAACIRVTRFTVPLRNLPETWQGSTVALVTDLHLGNISGSRFSTPSLVSPSVPYAPTPCSSAETCSTAVRSMPRIWWRLGPSTRHPGEFITSREITMNLWIGRYLSMR